MSTEPLVVTWLAQQVADDRRAAEQAEDDWVDSQHQAEWTPRRALAECAAKQTIIDGYRTVHKATNEHAEELARDFHRSAHGHGPDPRLDDDQGSLLQEKNALGRPARRDLRARAAVRGPRRLRATMVQCLPQHAPDVEPVVSDDGGLSAPMTGLFCPRCTSHWVAWGEDGGDIHGNCHECGHRWVRESNPDLR